MELSVKVQCSSTRDSTEALSANASRTERVSSKDRKSVFRAFFSVKRWAGFLRKVTSFAAALCLWVAEKEMILDKNRFSRRQSALVRNKQRLFTHDAVRFNFANVRETRLEDSDLSINGL